MSGAPIPPVPRYKLTIAYDGTDFCGWQKQFPHADAVPGALTKFRDDDPPETAFEGQASRENSGDAAAPAAAVGEPSPDALSPGEPRTDRARTELRTVQSVVERAVRLVVRQPVVVLGSSRTDSGVHARGQVCAFTTADTPLVERPLASSLLSEGSGSDRSRTPGLDIAETPADSRTPSPSTPPLTNHERFGGGWPAERGVDSLVRALNTRLPGDVLVRNAELVGADFDPIGDARSKAYSYTIHNSRQRSLWERRTSLHIWHELDPAAMNDAAGLFVGEHDFAGFAAAGHGRLTTIRTVFSCAVHAWPVDAALPGEVGGRRMVIDISGSGFLWNMVRIIAGTLVEVGKGKLKPEQIREALRTGDRRLAGPTLPPHGLCLEWIKHA